MTNRMSAFSGAVAAAAVLSIASLHGATRTWNGQGDGLRWSDPDNWEEDAAPTSGSGDVITLSNDGSTPVISNDLGTVSIGKITVTSGNVTLVGDPIAFDGSKDPVIDANQSLTLVISNDLALITTRGQSFELPTSFTLAGDLTASEPASPLEFVFYSRGSGRTAVIDGDVSMPGWNLKNVIKSNSYVQFNGALACNALRASGGTIGGDTGNFYLNSSTPSFSEVRAGYSSVKCLRANAIAPEALVSFGGYSEGSTSVIDLNGNDQVCDRVASVGGSSYWCSGNFLRSAGAARLTMNGTDDAVACCKVDGAITLVWNPSEARTQVFSNRVNTTTGDIIVSNGTFSVSGKASFANVTKVVVADGATFELTSTLASSFSSLTEITVGKNAFFTIGDGAANPFANGILTVSLDETASFRVGANVSVTLAALKVGGVAVEGGDYSGGTIPQITGTGRLSVPESETPTKDLTWTAGAAPDESVRQAANWSSGFETSDLRSRGLRPLFADAGTQALIDTDVDFKGLRFALPASDEDQTFTLSAEGSATMKLRSLGIATTARAGANHVDYAIDVPVVLKDVEQTWSLADEKATLKVLKPISGETSISKTGAGALELHAPNDSFTGNFSAAGGTLDVYAPSNGLGSANAGTAAELNAVSATYTFHGVRESRAIVLRRNISYVDTSRMVFAAGTTNVLSGTLTFKRTDDGVSTGGFTAGRGAVVITEKTVTSGQVSGFSGGGTWICRGPLNYNQLMVGDGRVRLETKTFNRGDGEQPVLRLYDAGAYVVCTITNQLFSDWNYLNLDQGVFDLNGYPQKFGGLMVNDAEVSGGAIHSDRSAILTVGGAAVSSDAMILTKPDFTGAVSFNGPVRTDRTFTVNRAVSSTGSISVPGGTFAFTSLGSWRNGSRVDVTGTGRLQIAVSKTLGCNAVVSVAGTGYINLAAGVRQKCGELWIDGQKCAPGVWGSAESGAPNTSSFLTGTGVFVVGRRGVALILR